MNDCSWHGLISNRLPTNVCKTEKTELCPVKLPTQKLASCSESAHSLWIQKKGLTRPSAVLSSPQDIQRALHPSVIVNALCYVSVILLCGPVGLQRRCCSCLGTFGPKETTERVIESFFVCVISCVISSTTMTGNIKKPLQKQSNIFWSNTIC